MRCCARIWTRPASSDKRILDRLVPHGIAGCLDQERDRDPDQADRQASQRQDDEHRREHGRHQDPHARRLSAPVVADGWSARRR